MRAGLVFRASGALCSKFTFGCLTCVHRVIPELDSNGDVVEWKHRGWYYFVHNKEIRESYDTWKVIEALRDSGFQSRQPEPSQVVVVAPTARK